MVLLFGGFLMKLKNGAALALVLTSSLGATAISLPTFAAEADESPADNELTEIVVTAEKRAENLQEVPIAVSAFTTKERDLIGIETLEDLSNYTPGVTFDQADDRVSIRGITRSTNNLAIDPGVALYVDGFYRTFNDPVEDDPLFTQQVEILRGPQGTLTGRNAIGGAINYTSSRPTHDFEGEARATVGNFEERSFEASMGGPINDWLRFKILAGDFVQNEGYIQSITGHQNDELGLRDNQEFQVQLEGNIGDNFDWWAKADHRDWNEGFGNTVDISPFNLTNTGCTQTGTTKPGLVCPGFLTPSATYSSGPGLNPTVPPLGQNISSPSNPYTIETDTETRDFLKNDWTYVFQAAFHMGFADLKYIGGYNNYEYDLDEDFDGTNRASYVYTPTTGAPPVTINSQSHLLYQELKHFFSNELDLVSTGDSPLQYVLGFYNYHEHFNQPVNIESEVPQLQLCNPTSLVTLQPEANPGCSPYQYNQATSDQSNAVFGQLDWKFVPTWKAELGLRYTKDQKASDERAREVFWDPTTGGALQPAFDVSQLLLGDVVNGKSADGVNLTPDAQGFLTRHLDIKSHALTGTAGLNWLPNKDTLMYLSYTRGYKDAGLNSGVLVTFPYVKPEFIDAYEAGWKQTYFNQLQLDTSLYYYNYIGAQFPLNITSQNSPPVAEFFNINEKIYGAEFESKWAATDALRFNLAFGWNHARFSDKGAFANGADQPVPNAAGTLQAPEETIDGNRVPGTPDYKASFNANYSFKLTNGSLVLSGSYLWRSSSSSTVFNEPLFVAPSYGQTDLRATWFSNSHYTLVGYIRNAFNVVGKDAITGGQYVAGGYAGANNALSWQLIPPRTYGIEARYRFGDNPL
jgi:iron complex outermembrane receptor protein